MARTLALLLVSVVLICAACAGGQGLTGGKPADATDSRGLPALANLPAPQRTASLSGPGWHSIALDTPVAVSSGADAAAGLLTLPGTAPVGYAVYGVLGFGGGAAPSSVKVTLSGAASEYYVGFSDYKHGRWEYAGPFNGTVETSFPMAQHSSATEFLSPLGACYIAVLVGVEDSLAVTQLELGVDGGTEAPLPPTSLRAAANSDTTQLNWMHSLSRCDLDFSGYLVERAPLLTGVFTPLITTPEQRDAFLDMALTPGVSYRYRVCAVDVGGNRSAWAECNMEPNSVPALDPVAVLDAPQDILYGPADVTFDMTQTYIPGGAGTLDVFTLTYGETVISQPANPLFHVTLQPGCYLINGIVQATIDSGTRTDSTTVVLKVLPRWQAAPVPVREPDTPTGLAQARLELMRGAALPDGTVALLGYDPTVSSLACWRGLPTAQPQLKLLPVGTISATGEPALTQGSAFFPVARADEVYCVRVNATDAEVMPLAMINDAGVRVAAAASAQQAWVLFSGWDALASNWMLKIATLSGQARNVTVLTSPVNVLDAVYNTATGTVDIAYGDNDSVEFVRWDPVSNNISAASTIAATTTDAVDIELDPAVERPVVLYSNSNVHYYCALDDLAAWSAPQAIADNMTNFVPCDIAFDDGVLYAAFATWPSGVVARYKYEADAWTRVNTVSFSGDDGYQLALMPVEGNSGVLLADVDNLGQLLLAQLDETAADSVLWTIAPSEGQGFQLCAAGGSDGLHCVWRSALANRLRHYMSADGGATWTDADPAQALPLGATDLDITVNSSNGALYLSYGDGVQSHICAWNAGAQSLAVANSIAGGSSYRAYLSRDYAGVLWGAYDPGENLLHCVAGTVIDQPVLPDHTPVYDGVINGSDVLTDWGAQYTALLLTGGWPSGGGYGLALLAFGDTQAHFLVQPPYASRMLDQVVRGRSLDTTTYLLASDRGTEVTARAYFATYGGGIEPWRYEITPLSSPGSTELPLGDTPAAQFLRTVSVATAQDRTGVVLLSSLDGSARRFEWSNFGQWEAIPLPQGFDHTFQPELTVGRDGRWHLLYKDYRTDQLMCWSSL